MWNRAIGAAAIAILLLGLGALVQLPRLGEGSESVGDQPILVPPPPEVNPGAIEELLPEDSIKAIDDPRFETAESAFAFMKPDERVIGVVINGDARAYPINVLSVHEIVNDEVGGEPVAITWCPLCYSALVFSRRVEGMAEPLSFGVSGKLLHETLVMVDRQSGTLWSQLYGAAVAGEFDGKRLAIFPSVFTEWSAWNAEHPAGLVLSKGATCGQHDCGAHSGDVAAYAFDPYKSYYVNSDAGVINDNMPRTDQTLGTPKERVLGVRVGGVARAYPYDVLSANAILNDEVSGLPIVVWFNSESQTGAAFSRRLGEQTLTFRIDPADLQFLIDEESGSRWLATTGKAIDGRLAGSELPALITTSAFAFGWFDYFPNSDTYLADSAP
jgi:hypothetical protein